jgi:2-oxo-4-hydroxy-4-carboxy-5-ureidoimidazoline decarboxylase
MAVPLADINALDAPAFSAKLGGIYEHSRWVAQRAWPRRPFASVQALHAAMQDAVNAAQPSEQLALIRAHPELGGRLAMAGKLTEASRGEQSGAGLDQCTPEEFAQLQALNAAYRAKFGFPFIVAVRGLTRAGIIAAMRQRLDNTIDEERAASLREIGRIAQLRLQDLIED